MTSQTLSPAKRFFATPFSHAFGSFISWFLYLMCFTLTGLVFSGVAAVGGRCASGNTVYVIKTHCPAGATIFMPWAIFGLLLAVAIGLFLTQGWGVPLVAWAWPILFCSIGALFFGIGGVEGIIFGIGFVIGGLIPPFLELRHGIQRTLIGTITLGGTQLAERGNVSVGVVLRTKPNQPGAVRPGVTEWVLGPVLFLAGALGGIYVALIWYSNVAS